MLTNDTKNKIRTFKRKLEKEDINKISVSKCNGYVQHLEDLKKLLNKIGFNWVEDMEEVYEVRETVFGGVDEEDLEETLAQMDEQIDLIMTRLGIEEEIPKEHPQNISPMSVNISPSFSQNTNISIEAQVKDLYNQFNNELKKPNPDKSILKNILETILKTLGILY